MGVKNLNHSLEHFRISHAKQMQPGEARDILVDAEALVYWVSLNASNARRRVDVSACAEAAVTYVKALQLLTTGRVVLYFDGSSSNEKISISISRREQRIRTACSRKHQASICAFCPLPLLKTAVKEHAAALAASGARVEVRACWGEADPHLSADARALGAFVYTIDNDFYCHGVKVITLEREAVVAARALRGDAAGGARTAEVVGECRYHDSDFVATALRVAPRHLPVLAVVCGTDYTVTPPAPAAPAKKKSNSNSNNNTPAAAPAPSSQEPVQSILQTVIPDATKGFVAELCRPYNCKARKPGDHHTCVSRLFPHMMGRFFRYVERNDPCGGERLTFDTLAEARQSVLRILWYCERGRRSTAAASAAAAAGGAEAAAAAAADGCSRRRREARRAVASDVMRSAERLLACMLPHCPFYTQTNHTPSQAGLPRAFLRAFEAGEVDCDFADMLSGSSTEWWSEPIKEVTVVPTVVRTPRLRAIRAAIYGLRYRGGGGGKPSSVVIKEYLRLSPGEGKGTRGAKGTSYRPVDAVPVPFVFDGAVVSLDDCWGDDEAARLPASVRRAAALSLLLTGGGGGADAAAAAWEGRSADGSDDEGLRVAVLVATLLNCVPRGGVLNVELEAVAAALLRPTAAAAAVPGPSLLPASPKATQLYAALVACAVHATYVFDIFNVKRQFNVHTVLVNASALAAQLEERLPGGPGVDDPPMGRGACERASAAFVPGADAGTRRVQAWVEGWCGVEGGYAALAGSGEDSEKTFFSWVSAGPVSSLPPGASVPAG